jgi:hypothetical protein
VKRRDVDDAGMEGVAVTTEVSVVTKYTLEVTIIVSETVVVVGTSFVVVEVAVEMDTLVAVSVIV